RHAPVPDRLARALRLTTSDQARPLRHNDDQQPNLAGRHRRDAPPPPAPQFSDAQALRRLHPGKRPTESSKPLLTGTKSRIFVLTAGAGVTPDRGSMKPTAGFIKIKL